jgi:hypothetical protein
MAPFRRPIATLHGLLQVEDQMICGAEGVAFARRVLADEIAIVVR